MSEDPKPRRGPEEEEARAFIMSRRARFVAAAMASAGVMVCAGQTKTPNPNPCLPFCSLAACPASATYRRAGRRNHASIVREGAWGVVIGSGGYPQPCLEPPQSGGYGGTFAAGGTFGAGGAGGMPQPCLSGTTGAGGLPNTGGMPQPCLGMVATGGTPPETDAGTDAAASGGSACAAGAAPQPCLSIPK
jgi:hypothetical protein